MSRFNLSTNVVEERLLNSRVADALSAGNPDFKVLESNS